MSGDGTKSVHGATPEDPGAGPIGAPLYRTSTFRFASTEDLRRRTEGDGRFYARYGHPNFERVERAHAGLHDCEDSVLFASGMAATAAVFQSHCVTGDRVVAQRDLYGGTLALLGTLEERWGIEVTWVDTGDLTMLEAALPGARLYMGENPTNPLLQVIDLEAIGRICQDSGALFVLDATFDGPINLKVHALGADLVVESATKSLGGHSDVLAGLVSGTRGLCLPVRDTRKVLGAIPGADSAWLLERGLKTLAARVRAQNLTALQLAQRLAEDARVSAVIHAGLPTHPQRELIDRLAAAGSGTAGGSMIAFRCAAGPEAAIEFCDTVRIIANAPSLGGVESLVSLPRFTSHANVPVEARQAAGISDDLVRLSIGLEDAEDLWADIDAALR